MCEMLLQSGNDEIEVLPALPEQWSSGEVKGLRARGGHTVDIRWEKSAANAGRHQATVTISSMQKGKIRVNCEGVTRTVKTKAGGTFSVTFP